MERFEGIEFQTSIRRPASRRSWANFRDLTLSLTFRPFSGLPLDLPSKT
jgi:hypothetical protein